MGKLLILFGAIFIVAGIAVQLLEKLPGVGRLPGDILIKRGPVTFYFPFVTCLLISLVLSILASLFWRR